MYYLVGIIWYLWRNWLQDIHRRHAVLIFYEPFLHQADIITIVSNSDEGLANVFKLLHFNSGGKRSVPVFLPKHHLRNNQCKMSRTWCRKYFHKLHIMFWRASRNCWPRWDLDNVIIISPSLLSQFESDLFDNLCKAMAEIRTTPLTPSIQQGGRTL